MLNSILVQSYPNLKFKYTQIINSVRITQNFRTYYQTRLIGLLSYLVLLIDDVYQQAMQHSQAQR